MNRCVGLVLTTTNNKIGTPCFTLLDSIPHRRTLNGNDAKLDLIEANPAYVTEEVLFLPPFEEEPVGYRHRNLWI